MFDAEYLWDLGAVRANHAAHPHSDRLQHRVVKRERKMKWKIFLTFKEELRWQFLENIPLLETVAINSPGGHGLTFSIGCEMKLDSNFIHNACQFCADPEKLVDCCKHHFVISGEWTFLRFCDRSPLIRSRALTARYLVQLDAWWSQGLGAASHVTEMLQPVLMWHSDRAIPVFVRIRARQDPCKCQGEEVGFWFWKLKLQGKSTIVYRPSVKY